MRHLLYIICAIVLGGCNNGRNVPALNDVVFDSIPSNAYFVAENEEWKIFLNDETTGDSIEGVGAVKQVSLWTYCKPSCATCDEAFDISSTWYPSDNSAA